MERVLRARLSAAVVLAVVFGAGVLLGLAVSPPAPNARADRGRGDDAHRVPMYMQVTPTPTESQQARIDSIFRVHRAAMKALHDEFRKALDQFHKTYDPRYQALINETREQIKGVLTPEQAAQYDSILAENARKRAERAQRPNRE